MPQDNQQEKDQQEKGKKQNEAATKGQQEKNERENIEAVNPFTGQTTRQGEDVGEESDTLRNRMESIREKMKSVQDLLIEQKLDKKNQDLQGEIITELKSFMTDQQKQSSKPERDKKEKEDRKKGDQAATSSNTSNKPNAEKDDEARKKAEIQKRFDEIWGHLPDRIQQNELNIGSIQFLPKYRDLIKAYFKRLANDPDIR